MWLDHRISESDSALKAITSVVVYGRIVKLEHEIVQEKKKQAC